MARCSAASLSSADGFGIDGVDISLQHHRDRDVAAPAIGRWRQHGPPRTYHPPTGACIRNPRNAQRPRGLPDAASLKLTRAPRERRSGQEVVIYRDARTYGATFATADGHCPHPSAGMARDGNWPWQAICKHMSRAIKVGQIRLGSSIASRVVNAETIVRSAAVYPPFQRGQLLAISRPPGGTELTISAISAGRIHAALEVAKSAICSASVVVEAPRALHRSLHRRGTYHSRRM